MPGLIRGVARTAAVAGTATAVAGRVSRRQQNRWAEKDQAATPEPAAPEPAAPEPSTPAPTPAPAPVQPQNVPAVAPTTDDKLAQLRQLGELRDAGVLTEAEFEAQKGKLLYA